MDTLELIVVSADGAERPVSSLIRTTTAMEEGGTAVWLMVQHYDSPDGTSTVTSVVRRADLAPLRYAARVGRDTHRIAFEDGRVHGTIQPADSAARTLAYEIGLVFNAVMDVDVIRSLPLRTGFVTVTGSTTIDTAEGPVSAWVVEYRGPGAPATLWIGAGSHRFLRLRVELPDGTAFWKLHRRDMEAWRRSR